MLVGWDWHRALDERRKHGLSNKMRGWARQFGKWSNSPWGFIIWTHAACMDEKWLSVHVRNCEPLISLRLGRQGRKRRQTGSFWGGAEIDLASWQAGWGYQQRREQPPWEPARPLIYIPLRERLGARGHIETHLAQLHNIQEKNVTLSDKKL